MNIVARKANMALIVDDEPDIRELLELTLLRMGIEVRAAENLASARRLLATDDFQLCLTDMQLPDGNGIDLVRNIQKDHPGTPVAVITAHGNVESAVEALKAGAFDFVSKPVELQVLRNLVTTALRVTNEKRQPGSVGEAGEDLLGDSPAMAAIRATIAKVARSQAPVYVSGESGTGKERVARLIHKQGPRADKPFVPVNCGAIPADLVESELFGHKKGSFTGAVNDKEGMFQAANGGSLFLDEVADLPLHTQVKLLRAIQEKSVRPVGSNREVRVDVRILSATHKNLTQLVREGEFREDLYYRINVIEVAVPPLRDRVDDIPPLVDYFLACLSQSLHRPVPHLDNDAMDTLLAYRFPGNVRELENILERALTLSEGDTVTVEALGLPQPANTGEEEERGLDPYLDTIERDAIMKALEQTRYNKTAAAKLLGISFRALRYRLKKLGVE